MSNMENATDREKIIQKLGENAQKVLEIIAKNKETEEQNKEIHD